MSAREAKAINLVWNGRCLIAFKRKGFFFSEEKKELAHFLMHSDVDFDLIVQWFIVRNCFVQCDFFED